jgi:hypothetical protein
MTDHEIISKDWVAVVPDSHFSHLSSSFSGWKNCCKLRSTVHVSSSESSPTSTDRWRYISSLDLFRLQEEEMVPIKYVPVIQLLTGDGLTSSIHTNRTQGKPAHWVGNTYPSVATLNDHFVQCSSMHNAGRQRCHSPVHLLIFPQLHSDFHSP